MVHTRPKGHRFLVRNILVPLTKLVMCPCSLEWKIWASSALRVGWVRAGLVVGGKNRPSLPLAERWVGPDWDGVLVTIKGEGRPWPCLPLILWAGARFQPGGKQWAGSGGGGIWRDGRLGQLAQDLALTAILQATGEVWEDRKAHALSSPFPFTSLISERILVLESDLGPKAHSALKSCGYYSYVTLLVLRFPDLDLQTLCL